jgi:diaminopimelate decarboxylase
MEKKIVKKIVSEYGSPLYVFHKDDFVKNYKRFENCFKSLYSRYQLSYSYKTNYTPAICKIVKELGGYAEVVSDMEYTVAKKIGYENSKIVYNGPIKGPLSIEHLLNGGILNIDNLQEVQKVCDLARANPYKQLEVGLRVNINIGQHFISRFGLDTDSEDVNTAFKLLKENGIKVVGLHCHVGQSRTVEAWESRSRIMLALADKYFTNDPPRFLDLGSGMFAVMHPSLAKQFGDNIPTFEQYAGAVGHTFAEHYASLSEENRPILLTEPGTTLVNSYTDFIGCVDSIKHIKGEEFVEMDCSKYNIGDISQMKQLPIEVISCSDKQVILKNAKLAGYTCLEHDVMYKGFTGELGVGDYIVFANVGGYSNNSKPPFISPNCAMVELSDDGSARLIMRREEFDDVFATYMF